MRDRFAVRQKASGGKWLSVYVHGYYTTLPDTAVETALALQKGLQFPGPVIVYSWPSRKTSVLAYGTDEANAEWSMPHFKSFLGKINKAFPGMPVSLAGYSLGSRFVTNGIAFFRREGCNGCFGRAVLFAPDGYHWRTAHRAHRFKLVLREAANQSHRVRTGAVVCIEQRPSIAAIGKVPRKSARGAGRRQSRPVQRRRHGRRELSQGRRFFRARLYNRSSRASRRGGSVRRRASKFAASRPEASHARGRRVLRAASEVAMENFVAGIFRTTEQALEAYAALTQLGTLQMQSSGVLTARESPEG